MTPGHEDDLKLTEQAARWIEVLQSDCDERAAFFKWLSLSPRHVEELLSTLAFMGEIGQLTTEQRERIASLARDPEDVDPAGAKVITLGPHAQLEPSLPVAVTVHAVRSSSRSSRWRRPVLLVAAVALAVVAVWWERQLDGQKTYETGIGEQRTLQLPDGSTLHLNTHSRVTVHFTPRSRNLTLLEGEAMFAVRHDATRPFRVHTGSAVVRAVGTQFDVYRRAEGTRVSVIDGVVEISATPASEPSPQSQARTTVPPPGARLAAGQVADIGSEGAISRYNAADMPTLTSWRQHRLVFREETLGRIAEEFNRYNVRPKIRVAGNAASQEHFSGTFDVNAPEVLGAALATDRTLVVERTAEEIIVRAR